MKHEATTSMLQHLVWDATCLDTLAQSYQNQATSRAGVMVDLAEERKIEKYSNLGAGYSFTPVAMKTFGSIGKKVIHVCERTGPHSQEVYRRGEGKGLPLTASFCSCSEGERGFSVGIRGRPVRATPVLLVKMPRTVLFISSLINLIFLFIIIP